MVFTGPRHVTHIAVYSQFQILGKIKTLHNANVPKVEEPDIRQNLSRKCKPCHDSTEDVDIDLHVGCCIYNRKLHNISTLSRTGRGLSLTGT